MEHKDTQGADGRLEPVVGPDTEAMQLLVKYELCVWWAADRWAAMHDPDEGPRTFGYGSTPHGAIHDVVSKLTPNA